MTSRSSARPPLTRDRVLAAAMELADADGIGSLTMRKIARALGVEAMSLYHHVSNKDEILDGIVDRVVEEIELPSQQRPWRDALRSAAISANAVLRRHPWAATILLAGPRISAARLRQMDAILGCLHRAEFSPELTERAYHCIDSHIFGFTLWQVGIAAGAAAAGPPLEFLAGFDREELPHFYAHVEQHTRDETASAAETFAFGLDVLLDGFERLHAAG